MSYVYSDVFVHLEDVDGINSSTRSCKHLDTHDLGILCFGG